MGCPASLERTHLIVARPDLVLVVRRDWKAALPVEALLDGAPLERWGSPVPHELRGRDRVEVLDTPRGQIVAKRMSRGGLLGGLWRHTYFDPWRPAWEADLAERLAGLGCPTPPVVVARARRSGPRGWQLELATARVSGARDLLDALDRAATSPAASEVGPLMAAAGRTVRRLHDVGLRHRDLQVKNLLVPPDLTAPVEAGLLVVLDLDRCQLGAPLDGDQRRASLARLGRSAVKAGLLPGHGHGRLPVPSLAAFFRGYGGFEGLSPAAWSRQVRAQLARRLRSHRRFWSPAGD